jgi:tetratricopeptide (TPR) repeat protein
MELGRIYTEAGHAERAIPILTEAVGDWEQLVKQAANLSPSETLDDLFKSDEPEAKHRREPCVQPLVNNLVATLSDLANALMKAGRLVEALSRAEQVVKISRTMRNERSFVVGCGQTAQILMEQGHYRKAAACYDQAMETIRHVGDKGLEALWLQGQGKLARLAKQCDRAGDLYKQALRLFREVNDEANIMRTYNHLGIVEQMAGRLSEAMAWYLRSREIAQLRGDTVVLGDTAQNIGIVCRNEGNAARQCGDEETAQQRYKEAERFLQEGLQIRIGRQDKPGEAESQLQLSAFYLQMGELNKAEVCAYRLREICESLGLKDLYMGYHILAEVARARGNEAQTAQWETKRDEVRAELARRARGGDAANQRLSSQQIEAITQLAAACVRAGLGGTELSSEAEATVAQVESDAAGLLQPLGHYLRRLASGPASETIVALATPPADLAQPLSQIFAKLHQAACEAGGG